MARSKPSVAGAGLVSTAVALAAANWPPGSRICVAFSGGSDSTVLLHALAAERAKSPDKWELAAHHVHHGLSPHAGAWATHCETLCASLSVPFTMERVTVDQQAGTGIEAAARDARMASLDRINADVIVLAHHARDQAETLLLQLLRGSGPPGMAAMPMTAQQYLRPLLSVAKITLLDYAQQHALRWIDDESNADNRFSRNRLRNNVWPALIDAFPAAEATLFRATQHQADATQLLEDLAGIDAATCVVDGAINLAPFNEMTQARRANLLRFWLHSHDVKPPAAETLREWLKQLASVTPIQAIELRGGAHQGVIRVYRGHAHMTDDAKFWQPRDWSGEPSLELRCGTVPIGELCFTSGTQHNALRPPRAGEAWTVRMRKQGDGVALSERSGHVALKNIFQQANIPPWLRNTWPLVLCNDDLVCVAGVATAKAFTVATGESGLVCQWKPAWVHPPRS